jgi:hypothetical protein
MAKPYEPSNEVASTIAAGNSWTRGTDTSIVLTDGSDFDADGGYIRIGDAASFALMEYTGKTGDDTLTGLAVCTLGVVVSSGDETKEWPAGTAVNRVLTGEEVDDRVAKGTFTAQSILAAVSAATPAAVSVDEQRVLGRITGGNITGLTAAQLKTLCSYLTDVVDDTTPELGGDLHFNGHNAELDDTLGSDHTYSGIIVTANVGESVAFPDLLYFDLSEAEWKKADADAIGTMPCQGMALESKADGEACKILLYGFVRDDTWDWTVDDSVKVLYVSTTAGALTETAVSGSGDYSQAVAMIRSADTIVFNPSLAMAKVA